MAGAGASEIYMGGDNPKNSLSGHRQTDPCGSYLQNHEEIDLQGTNLPSINAKVRRALDFEQNDFGDGNEYSSGSLDNPEQRQEQFETIGSRIYGPGYADDHGPFHSEQYKSFQPSPYLHPPILHSGLPPMYSLDSYHDQILPGNQRQLEIGRSQFNEHFQQQLLPHPPPIDVNLPIFHHESPGPYFPAQLVSPFVERAEMMNHPAMMSPQGIGRSFSSIPEDRPNLYGPRDAFGNLRMIKMSPRSNAENLYHQEFHEKFIPGPRPDFCGEPFVNPFASAGSEFQQSQSPFLNSAVDHLPAASSPNKAGSLAEHLIGKDNQSPRQANGNGMQGLSIGGSLPTTPKTPMEVGGSSSVLSSPSSAQNVNTALYKTELCRSWEETGSCRYGPKCQFAHGKEELRPVTRHPKYKTEVCRTFSTNGTCPYGKRCRFIHKSALLEPSEAVLRSLSEDLSMMMKEKKPSYAEAAQDAASDEKLEATSSSTPSTPRRRLKIFAEIAPEHEKENTLSTQKQLRDPAASRQQQKDPVASAHRKQKDGSLSGQKVQLSAALAHKQQSEPASSAQKQKQEDAKAEEK